MQLQTGSYHLAKGWAALPAAALDSPQTQNADLRFTYFSDRHSENAGFDPFMLLGTCCLESDAYLLTPEAFKAYRDCISARKPFRDFTFGYSDGDREGDGAGNRYYMRISGEPIFDFDLFKGYRGVGTDVKTRARHSHFA